MRSVSLKLVATVIAVTYIMVLCNFSITAKASENNISEAPEITAETAIVADADTGYIYYNKDADKKMYPASITKILTGLIAVENCDDDEIITVTKEATKGITNDYANIALSPGEQITMEEALYTMFMASANDSANAIAIHIAGSIENFAELMNEKCEELGTKNSHFSNANGIFDEDNITSCYDMALITRACLKNDRVMKYFSETRYVMPETNFKDQTVEYSTLHRMMKAGYYKYDGVYAGKTGYEKESGHTLVTVAKKDGKNLICVVMKAGSGNAYYRDTTALLDYAFPLTPDNDNAEYVKKEVVETKKEYKPIIESKEEEDITDVVVATTPQEPTRVISKKVVAGIAGGTFSCLFALIYSLVKNKKKYYKKLQRKINICARLEQEMK